MFSFFTSKLRQQSWNALFCNRTPGREPEGQFSIIKGTRAEQTVLVFIFSSLLTVCVFLCPAVKASAQISSVYLSSSHFGLFSSPLDGYLTRGEVLSSFTCLPFVSFAQKTAIKCSRPHDLWLRLHLNRW